MVKRAERAVSCAERQEHRPRGGNGLRPAGPLTSRPVFLLLVVVAAMAIANSAVAQTSERMARFNQAYEEAQSAEGAGQWSRAAALYEEVLRLGPHEIVSLASLARCRARLNQPDEALRCLAEAVEHGWNQVEKLRTEPAFEDLRNRPEFEKLIVRIAEVEREEIVIYVPPALKPGPHPPLIIAFHGRGENPHYFLSQWKEAADKLGAVVALPRGVRRAGDGLLNLWEQKGAKPADVDLPACAKLADTAIELAKKRHAIEPQRIVLAGYSQGGAVALKLLAAQPERYAGAFAQATLYQPPAPSWPAALAKNRRVYLIAGELDRLRPQTESAVSDLKAAGWDVRVDTVPKVGHEPPEDNPRRQVEAVEWILAPRK